MSDKQPTSKASHMTRRRIGQMKNYAIHFDIKSKLKFSANSWLTHVPGAPKDLLVPSTVSCITASRLSSEAPRRRLSAKLCCTLFLHQIRSHIITTTNYITTGTHSGSFLKFLEFSTLGCMTSINGLLSTACL